MQAAEQSALVGARDFYLARLHLGAVGVSTVGARDRLLPASHFFLVLRLGTARATVIP
jgi:hypothetical protein